MGRRGRVLVASPKGHLAPIHSIKDITLYSGSRLAGGDYFVRGVLHEIRETVHGGQVYALSYECQLLDRVTGSLVQDCMSGQNPEPDGYLTGISAHELELGHAFSTHHVYIENKSAQPQGSHGVAGPARIGRVTFSKTGKSLHYKGKIFQSLKGSGFKANYYDLETGDQYWISGPKKNGADGLYGPRPTPIDDEVRE